LQGKGETNGETRVLSKKQRMERRYKCPFEIRENGEKYARSKKGKGRKQIRKVQKGKGKEGNRKAYEEKRKAIPKKKLGEGTKTVM